MKNFEIGVSYYNTHTHAYYIAIDIDKLGRVEDNKLVIRKPYSRDSYYSSKISFAALCDKWEVEYFLACDLIDQYIERDLPKTFRPSSPDRSAQYATWRLIRGVFNGRCNSTNQT